MISRPILHVIGPPGSGKTAFVEALMRETFESLLCVRGSEKTKLRKATESAPTGHPEILRYQQAGAIGAACFLFSRRNTVADDFYMAEFMSGFSDAVVIEGDSPLRHQNLTIYVTPPLQEGVPLLKKTSVPSSKRPVERWHLSPGQEDIVKAEMVVVNVRTPEERTRGERLLEEIGRLRKDETIFRDLFDYSGSRIPITAVVADLSNLKDSGWKKAFARVGRALRLHRSSC